MWAMDLRIDRVVTLLYCLLPVVNALAFLCSRKGLTRVVMQSVLIVGFIAAYTVLNWRTCSALGYCTTMSATLWTTIQATAVVQICEGLLLSAAVAWLEGRPLAKTERPA